MKLIKVSSKSLWHISNKKFSRFNRDMAPQGIFWFAKDKSDLVEHGHGASITSREPIYLYEVITTANNPAGWDEYGKYGIGQLEGMGYDSIDLDEDFVVFNTRDIKIVNVEMISKGKGQK